MNDFTNLTVGTPIGIITSGRRYSSCREGVVTRVTEKQIVVTHDNSTARYDRRTGYAIARHDHSSLAPLDSERWREVSTAQRNRNEEASAARREHERVREERFNLAALAKDDERGLRVLQSLADQVLRLEESTTRRIARRIARLTPRSLYREFSGLEASAAESAELDWWLTILESLATRTEGTLADALRAWDEEVRRTLLRPSSLSDVESRARLLAAREIHEKLSALIKYTLEA